MVTIPLAIFNSSLSKVSRAILPQTTLKSTNSPIFGLLGNNGLASLTFPVCNPWCVVKTSSALTI